MQVIYIHEIIRPTVRQGGKRGRRWRWWRDASWEEAAEDLQVHLGVSQRAVDAGTAPALAHLARNCRHGAGCHNLCIKIIRTSPSLTILVVNTVKSY